MAITMVFPSDLFFKKDTRYISGMDIIDAISNGKIGSKKVLKTAYT